MSAATMLRPYGQATIATVLVALGFGVALSGESRAFSLALTAVWALMAVGWNLISGYAGPVALGQGAFFGLTSFVATVAFAHYGLSPYVGIPVGVALSLLLAAVVGAITLRLSGLYFALATLTIPLLLGIFTRYFGVFEIPRPYVGDSWAYMQFSSSVPYYVMAAIALVAGVWYTAVMEKSKTGRYLVAIRENERAAASAGVPVYRYKFFAFMMASLFAAVAGGLYSQLSFVFNTEEAYGLSVSIEPLLIVLIGGAGKVLGPIVGSLVVIPLGQVLEYYFADVPGLNQILFAALLLVVALWLRGGIVGFVERRLSRDARKAGMVAKEMEPDEVSRI